MHYIKSFISFEFKMKEIHKLQKGYKSVFCAGTETSDKALRIAVR